MPFKRQFIDKYAGISPERICCPNSVRLVIRVMGWGFGAGSGLRGHGVGELEGS